MEIMPDKLMIPIIHLLGIVYGFQDGVFLDDLGVTFQGQGH